jgi:hypothetical protein
LPYLEYNDIYSTLQIKGGTPWQEPSSSSSSSSGGSSSSSSGSDSSSAATPHQIARETSIKLFLCPSYKGPTMSPQLAILKGFGGNAGSGAQIRGALTNYKGMGGTQKESLGFRIKSSGTAPYGTAANHPDGVMFPDVRGVGMNEISDGLGNTIAAVETIETQYSRWMIGTEATLAGLPSASDPLKAGLTIQYNGTYKIYAPQGYNGQTDPSQSAMPNTAKTYLGYDYSDPANNYDTTQGGNVRYGPSSQHNAVTNHLFADGRAVPVTNTVDYALYMFLITRQNNDPGRL